MKFSISNMKFSISLLLTFLSFLLPITHAAKAFAGSSLYYAPGLTIDEQNKLFPALQSAGVEVLRVWLDGQSSGQKGTQFPSFPSLESSLGKYDDTVLNKLDDVMENAAKHGIKMMISCYSFNSLKGNKDDPYKKAYGVEGFYTKSEATSTFKKRLQHILGHVNKHNGKKWAEDSEHIFAFEAQNEAFSVDGTGNFAKAHASWQCDMAQTFKDAMGGKNDILITTGGGQWYDESTQEVYFSSQCKALDVVAIHAYSPGDLTENKMKSKVDLATKSGKKLLVQEWGACYFSTENNNCPQGGVLDSNKRNANIQNWGKAMLQAGLPTMYWQIIPNKDPHSGFDFEVGIEGDPSWDTLKNLLKSADSFNSPFDYSKWLPK